MIHEIYTVNNYHIQHGKESYINLSKSRGTSVNSVYPPTLAQTLTSIEIALH